MKYWLLILLVLAGCSRKAALQKETTRDVSISLRKELDSSFLTTQTSSRQYYNFGDTLEGGLLFFGNDTSEVDYVAYDSLESNGIKVIASASRQKNGIIKTKIKAIAKPRQIVNETALVQAEQKRTSIVDSIKRDLATKTKDKRIEVSNTWIIIAVVCIFIVIVGMLFYIYGQMKKWW